MKILLVADGRSPITRQWIKGVLALNHEVILVSSFPCLPVDGVADIHILPIAFAGLSGSQVALPGKTRKSNPLRKMVAGSRAAFLNARYWLGPLTLPFFRNLFRKIIEVYQPDLVHALRIPFEGMLAAYTPEDIPLVLSIWGNDLTLHGSGSNRMRSRTEAVLQQAAGLIADAHRDLRLARQWGYPQDRPMMVVPGGGGIDLTQIHQLQKESPAVPIPGLHPGKPLVINPRGFRPGSVRNDVFFQAVSLVLERNPEIRFICPAMKDQDEAIRWMKRLKLEDYVFLLPFLPQAQLWQLFSQSQVSLSISAHDGTPNSLLEAMACGCFPIAGDIESLREWIIPGQNGMLVEPNKPQAVAEALLLALNNPALRQNAAEINQEIIRTRAEVQYVRAQVEIFYQRLRK